MPLPQVWAREGRGTEVAGQLEFVVGAGMEEGMAFEILVAGEATLADEALKWLVELSTCNGHFSLNMISGADGELQGELLPARRISVGYCLLQFQPRRTNSS